MGQRQSRAALSAVASVLCARLGVWAAVCSITGEEAPAVVTFMASKTDPATDSWIVTPDCTYEQIKRRVNQSAVPSAAKVERIASIPTKTDYLAVWNAPLTYGADFSSATQMTQIDLQGFSIKLFDNLVFPSTLPTLLLSHNALPSIDKVQFPSGLQELQLVNNSLTSLKKVKFPSGLKHLDLERNTLKSIDFTFPSQLQMLEVNFNPITKLEKLTIPSPVQTLSLKQCGLTSVRLVKWPTTLQSLSFEDNPVATFEVRVSDVATLKSLRVFEGDISQTKCADETAEMQVIKGKLICVISDDRFEALYAGQATPQPATSKPDTSSSGNDAGSDGGSAGGGSTGVKNGTSSHATGPGIVDYTKQKNQTSSDGASGSSGSTSSRRTSAPKSGTTSDTDPANDASKDTTSPVVVPAAAATGGCVVLAIAIFRYYHKYGKSTSLKEDDGVPSRTYEIDETPSAETSLSDSSKGNADPPSQEYLTNDVRNDRSLIGYRIELRDLQLNKQIARGGYGVIYRGSFLGRDVAIKQMLPSTWQDDHSLSSFMDEVRLCARLDHPRVVSFVGVAWSSLRDLSVVIEFMAGGDLLLHKQPVPTSPLDWLEPWTLSRIKSKSFIAQDIAEAIVYLHSFNSPVLHRDLKAKNVLLDVEGDAKLSDFGISRELSVDETMTREVGTLAWIAPKVLRGERYSEKVDIYSLGVVLVEMDRCRHPYAEVSSERHVEIGRDELELSRKLADTRASVVDVAHKNTQIALRIGAGKLRPSVTSACPGRIGRLVENCVQYDPEARPTAMEVYYELRQIRKQQNSQETAS